VVYRKRSPTGGAVNSKASGYAQGTRKRYSTGSGGRVSKRNILVRSSTMNEETKPKMEILVRLEKHIAEKPDHYYTMWWPDGSLHSATHLDSGITYVVMETDECIGVIWMA
jgi:hypothetical protein